MAYQTIGTKTETRHHSFRVIWKDLSQPSEMLVKPYIERALELLPSWVQEVIVRDEDGRDNDSSLMSCAINSTYYSVIMVIHPGMYKMDVESVKHTVLHELLHVFMSPFADEVYEMTKIMLKDSEDSAAYKLLCRQGDLGMERVVEDLSWKLLGLVFSQNDLYYYNGKDKPERLGDSSFFEEIGKKPLSDFAKHAQTYTATDCIDKEVPKVVI